MAGCGREAESSDQRPKKEKQGSGEERGGGRQTGRAERRARACTTHGGSGLRVAFSLKFRTSQQPSRPTNTCHIRHFQTFGAFCVDKALILVNFGKNSIVYSFVGFIYLLFQGIVDFSLCKFGKCVFIFYECVIYSISSRQLSVDCRRIVLRVRVKRQPNERHV